RSLTVVGDSCGIGGQGGAVCTLVESLAGTSYNLSYGDDIDIYGLSLSKEFAGVSVGSDLNIRKNMPLSSIPAIVSAGGPLGLASGLGLLPPRSAGTGVVTEVPGEGDSMAATGDTLHWTLNGLLA